MALLAPALAYFALVFGAGFALGVLRVLLLVPLVGQRTAELLEMPLMLLVIVLAARWVTRRFLGRASARQALGIGFIAFCLLFIADLGVGVFLLGMTPGEALFNRDPVSGTAYALSVLLFAAMPWLLSRR